MGGGRVPLFAVVVALAYITDGRPQSHDQRSESFPVRSFNQADRTENQQRTQESPPIRQFSQMDTSERGNQGASDGLPMRPFSQSNHRASEGLPVRPFSQPNHRETSSESLPVSPFSHSNSQSSQRVVAPFDSRPVRPVGQSERGVDYSTRQSSNSNVRVSVSEDNPYQSRAHSAPPQVPRGTVQSSGQHHDGQETKGHRQVQGSNQGSQERKKIGEETPNWSNGQVRLDPKAPPGSGSSKSDGRGHSGVQNPSTAPHLRENRRTLPQNQKVSASRGQQASKEGVPSVRLGTVEVPTGDKGKAEGTINGAANPTNFDKEGIIFPGPTRDGGNNNPKVTPGKFVPPVGIVNPNCAKGSTFCESFEYYPSDYVKSVLKSEGETLKEFFGNDLLLNETDIVQRIDYQDENSLCPSKEDIVYPRMAQNKEDKWLYVVNQDQYVQGVRVETCLKPESECLLSESFPSGYKTTCRQKFIYRKLLALNDDGKPHSDVFRLPSCCSCFVKSVGRRKRR